MKLYTLDYERRAHHARPDSNPHDSERPPQAILVSAMTPLDALKLHLATLRVPDDGKPLDLGDVVVHELATNAAGEPGEKIPETAITCRTRGFERRYTQVVFVLIYEHKHGREIDCYATEALADEAVIEIARKGWRSFARFEPDVHLKFPGTMEAADLYFEKPGDEQIDLQDLFVDTEVYVDEVEEEEEDDEDEERVSLEGLTLDEQIKLQTSLWPNEEVDRIKAKSRAIQAAKMAKEPAKIHKWEFEGGGVPLGGFGRQPGDEDEPKKEGGK
jgi:hypothetical protein